MPTYWIIEHPNRGTLQEWRYNYEKRMDRPRFSTVGRRSDARKFHDLAMARKDLTRLREHMRGGYIMEMGRTYAQRIYDPTGFEQIADPRAFEDILRRLCVSGTGTQGPDYPMQWKRDNRVIAFSYFHRGTQTDAMFVRAGLI